MDGSFTSAHAKETLIVVPATAPFARRYRDAMLYRTEVVDGHEKHVLK
jgi:hypothetical protein